jgi:predicted nucleic acid-binding protein
MKIDFIADTNILVYVHEGNELVRPLLEYHFGISFITEVELLGFNGLTEQEERGLKALINDCFYVDWNAEIKETTIKLRKEYSIKLPDSIIAASSLYLGVPLITADKGFAKIKALDLILLEV